MNTWNNIKIFNMRVMNIEIPLFSWCNCLILRPKLVNSGRLEVIVVDLCYFVLFCSFWRLLTIKMIKSVKAFPFSFWKMILFLFCFIEIKFLLLCCKMATIRCRSDILTWWKLQKLVFTCLFLFAWNSAGKFEFEVNHLG